MNELCVSQGAAGTGRGHTPRGSWAPGRQRGGLTNVAGLHDKWRQDTQKGQDRSAEQTHRQASGLTAEDKFSGPLAEVLRDPWAAAGVRGSDARPSGLRVRKEHKFQMPIGSVQPGTAPQLLVEANGWPVSGRV